MHRRARSTHGFSMIELLVATAVFMVLAGAVFSVLFTSQVRYQSESGLTTAFQQANLVMDQIVRDVHSAGYPPPSAFSFGVSSTNYALAFPWSPSYPSTPCTLGACVTPGDYDLVVETAGESGTGVQWIRYSLQGTTLLRGAIPKAAGDPLGQNWTAAFTPYLENVVNQSNSQPIFKYYDGAGTLLSSGQPSQIRQVNVYLQVQSAKPDPQTHQLRTIMVTGQAVAFNANQ